MKHIALTNGESAIVDDEDYKIVLPYTWYAHKKRNTTYAAGYLPGTGDHVQMHTLLVVAPIGLVIDHRDRNGLNNQRTNLRVVTNSQNQANKVKQRGGYSSKYKGVSYLVDPLRRKNWRALLIQSGRHIQLGYYLTETEAAHAYNVAATKHFGEFARLNEIETF